MLFVKSESTAINTQVDMENYFVAQNRKTELDV